MEGVWPPELKREGATAVPRTSAAGVMGAEGRGAAGARGEGLGEGERAGEAAPEAAGCKHAGARSKPQAVSKVTWTAYLSRCKEEPWTI